MQKESLAKTLKHDLKDAKEQILTKLYKSVQVYLGMFTCQVRERDPTLEISLRPNDERIMTNLFDSPSMESTSNRMPLINLNRSIQSIEQSLKSLSGDLQSIR